MDARTPIAEIAVHLNRVLAEIEQAMRLLSDAASDLPLCDQCPTKPNCKEMCDDVRASLPGVAAGRCHRENLGGLRLSELDGEEKRRQQEIFGAFQACKRIFTPKQWRTICLYYRDGLTQAEIGKLTGKSIAAVSEILARGRVRMDTHQGRQREERYRLLKNADTK